MDGNRKSGLAAMAALVGLMVLPATSDSDTPITADSPPLRADSLALRIAARYGAEAFPGVKALRYKFNVRYKGKDVVREWAWFPVSDSVRYRGPDEKGLPVTAAYSRRNSYSMSSAPVAAIDKSFINRSEERRVGKECRSRRSPDALEQNRSPEQAQKRSAQTAT